MNQCRICGALTGLRKSEAGTVGESYICADVATCDRNRQQRFPKKKCRVAFVGASGTGKSTLAIFLAGKLGLPINPVGSRSVSEAMGYASPYDVDKAGRRVEFQQRLLREKCAWEAARDEFVVDRTTIDNLAYTTLHAAGAVDEEMFAQAIDGLWRYTSIIYCPLRVFCNLGDDPARVRNDQYHELFDVLVEGLLQRYARQGYYEIKSAVLEERKQEVLKHIGE